jgi:Rieske Fe-S protein
VQWNVTLETWDCPCHGSRFSAEGELVNGPAQRDLERIEL